MNRRIAIILPFVLLTIANFSDASTPLGAKYKIISEKPNNKFRKDILEIMLSKRIDKRTLRKIAITLREKRLQYDRLFIFYYIPGITVDVGAWAISHFTPDFGEDIKILGTTEKEDEALDKVTIKEGVIIGKWKDIRPMAESVMIIFQKGGKLKLKTTFMDGSSMEQEIVEKRLYGKTRYDYAEYFHGEYFILENNKNLGMYGPDGKFAEAKIIMPSSGK